MNKALILLLVTLVQSQSDGVVLSNDRFQNSQLEDWDITDASYPVDVIKDYNLDSQKIYRKRLVTNDAFTRRSALDKNFMRFGRGGEEALQKRCGEGHSDGKLGFHRFGRGLKDNFIRFGKAGDNFIRFGRGENDGFARFGKALPDDFFRAGKSLRENFIRFGKADENFMRFGRKNADEYYQDFFSSEEPFQRMDKASTAQGNFLRFGKSGKNGTNFLRFAKSRTESDDADEFGQDFKASGEAKRKKRYAQEKPPARSFKSKRKRSNRFFEISPDDFPEKIPLVFEGPRQNLAGLRNSRLTPFFPVYSDFPKIFDFYDLETKRNQGKSNFIRFG